MLIRSIFAGKTALALKRTCSFSSAKIERINTVARHVLLHNSIENPFVEIRRSYNSFLQWDFLYWPWINRDVKNKVKYNDAMTGKRVLRNLAPYDKIHRLSVGFPHKRPVLQTIFVFSDVSMNKSLNEMSSVGRFETMWSSSDVTVMKNSIYHCFINLLSTMVDDSYSDLIKISG